MQKPAWKANAGNTSGGKARRRRRSGAKHAAGGTALAYETMQLITTPTRVLTHKPRGNRWRSIMWLKGTAAESRLLTVRVLERELGGRRAPVHSLVGTDPPVISFMLLCVARICIKTGRVCVSIDALLVLGNRSQRGRFVRVAFTTYTPYSSLLNDDLLALCYWISWCFLIWVKCCTLYIWPPDGVSSQFNAFFVLKYQGHSTSRTCSTFNTAIIFSYSPKL